jgi:hypothetical protein
MKSPEQSLFLFAYKIDKKLAIAKRTKKVNFLVRALHYLEVYFFSFACIIGNFKLRALHHLMGLLCSHALCSLAILKRKALHYLAVYFFSFACILGNLNCERCIT